MRVGQDVRSAHRAELKGARAPRSPPQKTIIIMMSTGEQSVETFNSHLLQQLTYLISENDSAIWSRH